MLCSRCGNSIGENSRFCDRCGEPARTAQIATGPLVPTAASPSETSGKAIASLLSGLFGLIIFPAAIAAIVLGHISRSEIRKSAGRLKGSGLALGGLIMGYLGLSIIPVLIIAAIAIPNVVRARIVANEASAVSVVRALNEAEQNYMTAFPRVGYTCSLPSLGGNRQSSTSAEHAHLIDDEPVRVRVHERNLRLELPKRGRLRCRRIVWNANVSDSQPGELEHARIKEVGGCSTQPARKSRPQATEEDRIARAIAVHTIQVLREHAGKPEFL